MRNAIAQPQRQLEATFHTANNKTVDGTRDQALGFLRKAALPLRNPQSPCIPASCNFQCLQLHRRVIGFGEGVTLLLGDIRHLVGRMKEHVVGRRYVNDVGIDFTVERVHDDRLLRGFNGSPPVRPPNTFQRRCERNRWNSSNPVVGDGEIGLT